MTDINTDPRVLVLAPGDNVAIAKSDIAAGTTLQVMGITVTVNAAMEVGHKFAFIKVAKGGVIRRALRDVEREVGRDALEAEVRARGFHLVECGGQLIVICNTGRLQVLC